MRALSCSPVGKLYARGIDGPEGIDLYLGLLTDCHNLLLRLGLRGYGVTFGERSIERTPAETRAGSKSLEPDARLGQHLRIDVDSFNGTDAFMFQHRFGQGARSRAEVKHQGWASSGDFVGGPGQSFFVAGDELADGIVVGINLKAKMAADGVAHKLIVSLWFIDAHVQS